MRYYVYKTTCLTTGRRYYGVQCAHFLGLKNISGKKRMCKGRYVRKEFAEPVSLKTMDGRVYNLKDINQAKFELGLKSVSHIRQIVRGDRNSTSGFFRLDFESDNYHGAKRYRNQQPKK